MGKINEIKTPKGVDRIAVKQYDDKIVIEFIPEESKFKEGDILSSKHGILIFKEGDILSSKHGILIFKGVDSPDCMKYYAFSGNSGLYYDDKCMLDIEDFKIATEKEKQHLFDKLEAQGKRWNAEKLKIEDIPKRKFKAGDKVTLKSGCTSKSDLTYYSFFDEYLGKELIVINYTEGGNVRCNNNFCFAEDWLEPYIEEPKKGDLAIFWDNDYLNPLIRLYHAKLYSGNKHLDNHGSVWGNAVKWDGTKEQFEKVEKVLKGEID